jgi:hypothetical protein
MLMCCHKRGDMCEQRIRHYFAAAFRQTMTRDPLTFYSA